MPNVVSGNTSAASIMIGEKTAEMVAADDGRIKPIQQPRSYQMSDMRDKVALITGASSGIGRATAEAFVAKGAKVVLAARREDELSALANEIKDKGGAASFVITDVSVGV